jgi:hypothetical protein
VSDPTPHTSERPHPADRYYQQQLARTLRVAGNMVIGAYAGYGGAVIFSEETRGPRRGIARAVLGALGIAVLAELLALAAALVGAPSQAKLTTAPAPMSYLVRSLGGDRLVTIITLALLATFFNIMFATATRRRRCGGPRGRAGARLGSCRDGRPDSPRTPG